MIHCDVKALGYAFGITWMSGIVFLGILDAVWGFGGAVVNGIGSVYLGYAPTLAGILIGAVWSFIDGFIAGALMAWLYNKFAR